MTRLEIATRIAAALAVNCDDTSPEGLARLKDAALSVADQLIEACKTDK